MRHSWTWSREEFRPADKEIKHLAGAIFDLFSEEKPQKNTAKARRVINEELYHECWRYVSIGVEKAIAKIEEEFNNEQK